MTAPGAGGGEPGAGALTNEFGLKLRQRGKDAKHEPAIGGGRIDLGALTGWDLSCGILRTLSTVLLPLHLQKDTGHVFASSAHCACS